IVAGALPTADSSGDYYLIPLSSLNVGNTISVTLDRPSVSTINVSDVRLTIQRSGSGTALATSTSGQLDFTVATDGAYYVRVEGLSHRDIRAQYLLTIKVTDSVPPRIISDNLPAEGSTVSSVIDRFSLTVSEDLDPSI